MAAVVQIDERNGASAGVLTSNISNSNMGSVDSPNLSASANSLTAGASTYEKYQQIEVTNMGGSSLVNNLKVWRTGALSGAAVHKTNARTASYGGALTYIQPVNTVSARATQTMPTTSPGSANLGIAGSLSGSLSAIGLSDYLCHQIQTGVNDTTGNTTTLNYSYDEIA